MNKNLSEVDLYNKYYQEIVDSNGKIRFVGSMLQDSAHKFDQKIAILYQDQKISYKELYFRALTFSLKLRAAGVCQGDRVLLFFENSPEFYIAYFGIWQLGAVVTPLNTFLKEKELAHIVEDAKPRLMVVSSDKMTLFASHHEFTLLTEKDMDFSSPVPRELPEFTIPNADPDAMAALLYTSGTTGFPKGVMLSSRNIATNLVQGRARIPFDLDQRVFAILPLFHVFAQNACVWGSLSAGCTIVLVPKIDRGHLLAGLKHEPTIFLAVPALYGLLCLLKTAPLDSVNYFISGGDALPDKIRAAFSLIYRRKLCNGYGLTETSPLISVDFDDYVQPTSCVGKPVVGVSVSIRTPEGHPLEHHEIGVLWVKGDNIMMGYYNAPEMTQAVLHDGWFNTGDLARIDENGKIVICGRNKDLIINKGVNIYPQEIENIIMSHMAVLRVGVIGVVDDLNGEIPIAYVQLKEKIDNAEKVLLDLCKKSLADYKIPRKFIIIKDMPVTATGKVDKKILRAQQ